MNTPRSSGAVGERATIDAVFRVLLMLEDDEPNDPPALVTAVGKELTAGGAKGRIFGLQTQWGVRVSLARLRRGDDLTLLERAGVPEVWRRSVSERLALIDSSTRGSRRSRPS